MLIAGVQKLTLLDFPGKTAATVFTLGCNLRCPFCHNSEIVIDPDAPTDDPDDVLAFLRKRQGLLDGVCVSGGEPLLQSDLPDFLRKMRALGYEVKLDTNGTLPDRLAALLETGLVDRIAMDVKNAPQRYAETVGRDDIDLDAVRESMRILLRQNAAGGAKCELRTTVSRELHAQEDLKELARWIAETAADAHGADATDECGSDAAESARSADATGAETPGAHGAAAIADGSTDAPGPVWFIQNFKDSDTVLAGKGALHPWGEDDLKALLPDLQAILPGARLRGID